MVEGVDEQPHLEVFISYSRKDLDAAERLRDQLLARDFAAYLDKHDILPGEPWQERLGKLIEAADAVLFLISPDSIASSICDWEVNEAERLGKRILPVVVRDAPAEAIPGRLKRLNYIFLRTAAEEPSELERLVVTGLLTDIAWVREHTRMGQRAGEWQASGEAPSALLRGQHIADAEAWIAARPKGAPEITARIATFVAESRKAETARQRRATRRGRIIAAASLLAATIVAFLGWSFYLSSQDALRSQSLFLADLALQTAAKGDRTAATLIALEGLRDERASSLTARIRPYVAEAEHALDWSLRAPGRRIATLLDGANATLQLDLAFSPDGKFIAAGLGNGQLRVWTSDGEPHATEKAHDGSTAHVVFSPDSRHLLTWSDKGAARVWDTSGQLQAEIAIAQGEHALTFFDDGKRILVAARKGDAEIWSIAGQRMARLAHDKPGLLHAIAGPDGKSVVTTSIDGIARLWDDTGTLRKVLTDRQERASRARFSPDGRHVLAAVETSERRAIVRIWNLDGSIVRDLDAGKGRIHHLLVSPDGRYVFADASEQMAVWSLAGALIRSESATIGKDILGAAAFARASNSLLLGHGGTARLWSLDTRTSNLALKTPEETHGTIGIVAFSNDGSLMMTASGDGATLWDERGRMRAHIGGEKDDILFAAILSPNGRRILTRGLSNGVELFDGESTGLARLEAHEGGVWTVRHSRDGKRIATTGFDGTVTIWDAKTLEPLSTINGPEGSTYVIPSIDARFIHNDRWLLVVYDNRKAEIWDLDRGGKLAEVPVGRSVDVTPDGALLATDDQGGVRISTIAGEPRDFLNVSGAPIVYVRFSPDAKRLLTASEDGVVRLFEQGKAVGEFKAHAGAVRSAEFSREGRQIVTAGDDGTVGLWTSSGELIRRMSSGGHPVFRAMLSDNGDRVLGAAGSILLVWDTRGRLRATIDTPPVLTGLALSADGRRLLTASNQNKDLHVWRAFPTTADLITTAKEAVARCLTADERRKYFLAPEVPRWCYAMRKPPYGDHQKHGPPPLSLEERLVNWWDQLNVPALSP